MSGIDPKELFDFDGLLALSKMRVEVGVPGGKNAGLLYLHANGSPLKGIPARPVLEPALEDGGVQEAVAVLFADAVASALGGNGGAAQLEEAGALAEEAVKSYFEGGNLAPNAKPTIKAKGKDAPLIDTGGLRASITHRVKGG